MWTKISRKKLDLEKYSHCLQASAQYKIYAESWYLDIVAKENWFCLVWEDYAAVMPICFDKKLMQKRVIQPTFCQQLGVFSVDTISQKEFEEAYQLLNKSWVKSYAFNDENMKEYTLKASKKDNYVLDIQKPYEELQENYHKNNKRNIKKAQKHLLHLVKTTSLNELLLIKKEESPEKIQTFMELYKALESRNLGYVVEVKNNEDETLAASFWIISNNQLIYSLSGSTEKGKKEYAMFHLVDRMIEKNAQKFHSIDFEGSMNKGVSTFYKRFGAENHPYAAIKKMF